MISKVAFPWSLCQGEIGLSIESRWSSTQTALYTYRIGGRRTRLSSTDEKEEEATEQ